MHIEYMNYTCTCMCRFKHALFLTLNSPNGSMQYSVMSLLTSDKEGIGSIFSGFFSVDVGSRGICLKVVAK